MPCACNSKGASGPAAKSYVLTTADGSRKTYRTEVEAIAAQKRLGGSVKPQ